ESVSYGAAPVGEVDVVAGAALQPTLLPEAGQPLVRVAMDFGTELEGWRGAEQRDVGEECLQEVDPRPISGREPDQDESALEGGREECGTTRLPADGVVDHVHTAAAGEHPRCGRDVLPLVIDERVRAPPLAESALLLPAGDGDHASGADRLGELYGGRARAPRCTEDQDGVVGRDATA